ncbi:MFS transporter [Paenibacillus sp. NPDC058071]|uniref:MFS transporter n=1 Tax=Paenibacillus sp. NPDC058071 TaxID=3346326 RepID=UPI0036DB6879
MHVRSVSLYYFLFFLAVSSFPPYVSSYLSERGLTNTSIGLFVSLSAAIAIVGQPLLGMINDRMRDSRIILMLLTVLAPLFAAGLHFAGSFILLLLFYLMFNWFQQSAAPISDSLAVVIGAKEGFAFGNVRLWGALSYSLGVFATGFIYDRVGFTAGFPLYLGISVLAAAVLWLYPKTKPAMQRASIFEQGRQVLADKKFMAFTGISLLVATAITVNFTFLPIYFIEAGLGRSWTGTAFAVTAIVEVPMFWLAGKMIARIGRMNILALAAALYAAKGLAMFLFTDVTVIIFAQVLEGIAYAFFTSATVELAGQYASDRLKATYLTCFSAFTFGIGNIIGSTSFGMIIDRSGAAFVYLILGLLSAAAAVLYMTARGIAPKETQYLQQA